MVVPIAALDLAALDLAALRALASAASLSVPLVALHASANGATVAR